MLGTANLDGGHKKNLVTWRLTISCNPPPNLHYLVHSHSHSRVQHDAWRGCPEQDFEQGPGLSTGFVYSQFLVGNAFALYKTCLPNKT